MSGAHHNTIAALVAKVSELRDEKAFLDRHADDLQEDLDAAFFLSSDELPKPVFTTLRQELSAWP